MERWGEAISDIDTKSKSASTSTRSKVVPAERCSSSTFELRFLLFFFLFCMLFEVTLRGVCVYSHCVPLLLLLLLEYEFAGGEAKMHNTHYNNNNAVGRCGRLMVNRRRCESAMVTTVCAAIRRLLTIRVSVWFIVSVFVLVCQPFCECAPKVLLPHIFGIICLLCCMCVVIGVCVYVARKSNPASCFEVTQIVSTMCELICDAMMQSDGYAKSPQNNK